jgi:hypothetical protein
VRGGHFFRIFVAHAQESDSAQFCPNPCVWTLFGAWALDLVFSRSFQSNQELKNWILSSHSRFKMSDCSPPVDSFLLHEQYAKYARVSHTCSSTCLSIWNRLVFSWLSKARNALFSGLDLTTTDARFGPSPSTTSVSSSNNPTSADYWSKDPITGQSTSSTSTLPMAFFQRYPQNGCCKIVRETFRFLRLNHGRCNLITASCDWITLIVGCILFMFQTFISLRRNVYKLYISDWITTTVDYFHYFSLLVIYRSCC